MLIGKVRDTYIQKIAQETSDVAKLKILLALTKREKRIMETTEEGKFALHIFIKGRIKNPHQEVLSK